MPKKYTLICIMSEKKPKNLREGGGGGQVKNTLENLELMGLGTQGGSNFGTKYLEESF